MFRQVPISQMGDVWINRTQGAAGCYFDRAHHCQNLGVTTGRTNQLKANCKRSGEKPMGTKIAGKRVVVARNEKRNQMMQPSVFSPNIFPIHAISASCEKQF